MFGARGLYNFGWMNQVVGVGLGDGESRGGGELDGKEGMRIDEEEMMEGGLRGRFSAGGEVYFSARQRSFGSEWTFPYNPSKTSPLSLSLSREFGLIESQYQPDYDLPQSPPYPLSHQALPLHHHQQP